jgi:hypothetical protein
MVLHVQGKCQELELITQVQMLCGEGTVRDWPVIRIRPSKGHITHSETLLSNRQLRTLTNDSTLTTRHLHLYDVSVSRHITLKMTAGIFGETLITVQVQVPELHKVCH